MSDWKSAQVSDLVDVPERRGPHAWRTVGPKSNWPKFCLHCGHVPLRNEISDLITKLGCAAKSDPRVKNWKRTHRL